MNSSTPSSVKRSRSDNFDADDVELLVNLVAEHTALLDSPKLDQKKEGWHIIAQKFNSNCTGIKRDANALKMKVKNMKALSKKTKLEIQHRKYSNNSATDPLHSNGASGKTEGKIFLMRSSDSKMSENEDDGDDQDYEEQLNNSADNSVDSKSVNKTRKRCKKFTKGDSELLLQLHEKYCSNLDSSSSASSVKKRVEAWDNITEEFNSRQTSGITRDCAELKIKVKNLKALRVKCEPRDKSSSFLVIETHKPTEEIQLLTNSLSTKSTSTNPPQAQTKNYEDIYFDDDFEEDEEFQLSRKPNSNSEDKELQKIQRENILLKNSVLRKKERLLELQIALAERNLRRQMT